MTKKKAAPAPKTCPPGYITLSTGKFVKVTSTEDNRLLKVEIFGDDGDAVSSTEARNIAIKERIKFPKFKNAGMDPIVSTDTVPDKGKDGKYTRSDYRITYKFKIV
jgi:hypothetical protein